MSRALRCVTTIFAMLLSACAAPDASTHLSDIMAGQIIDVKRGIAVPKDALLRQLAAADFILLGEVHDNAEHHRLQAEVLRALIAQGRRPALAMEQFDHEFQPAIDAALKQPGASSENIGDAGRFNRKGWNWMFYAPLVDIAVAARLPIVAINLSRERTRDVLRQGLDSLGPDVVAELGRESKWSHAQQAIQMREIDEGHCRQLPPSSMPKMVEVQRARDVTMANALAGLSDAGAVVIAGVGHARNDVGVPFYLGSRMPGKRMVSIGFIEIDPTVSTVSDYVRPPATTLPFDYAWFTTAAVREDPCAGFAMPKRP